MKNSWTSSELSSQKNDSNMFVSLIQNIKSENSPKDSRIQKSLAILSNKVIELEEASIRLNKIIHNFQ